MKYTTPRPTVQSIPSKPHRDHLYIGMAHISFLGLRSPQWVFTTPDPCSVDMTLVRDAAHQLVQFTWHTARLRDGSIQ